VEVSTIHPIKSPEEILQEEFLRERAAVLGRAGEKVARTLSALFSLEKEILVLLESYHQCKQYEETQGANKRKISGVKRNIQKEINEKIKIYNAMREQAKTRYYYLIVTREALGLHKHQWVEAYYRIPPKRKYIEV
jgi:hypothetical protein